MGSEESLRSCSACGAAAPEEANFCRACGMALKSGSGTACPACHTDNPNHAQFCLACGAPLSSVADADRRIVSVLFADLSGFTQLTERMDPEEVRRLVAGCLERLSDCITRWGGFVDKFIGDCVMALFGAPVAYENEEERAVRAAFDMHAILREWSPELSTSSEVLGEYRPELTIGINTGPVVTGVFAGGSAQNYTAVGDTVNVASRLQGLCERGQVLVGSTTYDHTKHLFEFGEEQLLQVKGRNEPVRARRVLGVRAQRERVRGFQGQRTALVGRADELSLLRERWRRAAKGEFRVCTVTGPAGIGKTRLVEELIEAEKIGRGAVALGRSYPYASSTPWEPFAELIRDLHDLSSEMSAVDAAARIVGAAGAEWPEERAAGLKVVLGSPLSDVPVLQPFGAAERSEWITSAVTGSLERGSQKPRLLLLEDLHWADRTTLEFLCSLPALSVRGPILIVLITRPPLPGESLLAELLDSVSDRLDLEPLSPADARAFIDSLLGGHGLSDDVIDLIIERAGGNPLFIEETFKSLVEKGTLVTENGVWRAVGDLQTMDIPDTIESVLTTRIDRLESSTKQVLQYAAIVGRRFWEGVLADALAERPVGRELDDLIRSAFVRDVPVSVVTGDREFLFEHLLLQEAAYEGMLRGSRTELHGAVARWFEGQLGGLGGEYDEWIAFHFEHSKEPERALPYLEHAAQDARSRGALLDAGSLAGRALAVASAPEDRVRMLLLVEDIALAEGNAERRREAIDELEELAAQQEVELLSAEASYRRARYQLGTGDLDGAKKTGELALELFEKLEDISLQGDALRLLGRISHLWGDYPKALRFYRASLDAEQRAGDRHGQADVFDRLGLVQIDLGNFTTAIDRLRAARDIYAGLGDRPSEARVMAHETAALRWLGRLAEAEATSRSAIELAEQCGSRGAQAHAQLNLALTLAAKRNAAEAEPMFKRLAEEGIERLDRPRLAARAKLALADLQTGEAARVSAREARELGRKSGLVHVVILALTREAELDLEAGVLDAADTASAEAIRLLDIHCNIQGAEEAVLHTRGRVLAELGWGEEAAECFKRARTIVLNRADRIEDAELRRHYIEEVPLNRVILASGGGASA